MHQIFQLVPKYLIFDYLDPIPEAVITALEPQKQKTDDPPHLYFNEFNFTTTIERPLINKWNLILGLNAINYSEQIKKNNNQKVFPTLSKIGLIIGAELDKRNKEFNTTEGYFNEINLQYFDNQTIDPMIFGYLSRYLTELLPPNFILTKRSLTTTTSNS